MPDEIADLTLRPGQREDAAVLTRLFLDARDAAFPSMPRPVHTAEETRQWFDDLLVSACEVWVAEAEGEVVGYLVLEGAWLDSLYVRPDRVGAGIGSQLLDLVKALRPHGFGLWVFESNEPARGFYRHHGLAEISRTDGQDNEEGSPAVEMFWAGEEPMASLRRRIDALDDELAVLLDRRAALTALVQQHKAIPGHAGRDPGREAEIAERMSGRAVRLGRDRVRRIMDAVISASLDAAEEQRPTR